MARVSLIPKIGLGTEKINSQFKVSSKSLLETQKSVTNINKLLTNRIKVRKEIFSKIYETKKRREFDTRRQELEDEREARNTVVSGAIDNITSSISKTGGSLIGRLLKALGFIVAGWILRSLPTWIGYAKEFIARINELGRIIRSFISNVGNIFQSTGNLLRAAKENILKLDFFDSERNLRNSFSELGKSIEGVQKDFEDTINVFTTDITKEIDGVKVGSYSGEAIPEPGTGFTEDPTTPPQTYDSGPSSSGSSSGGGRWKPMLDLISSGEGGYDSVNPGLKRPEILNMTISELVQFQYKSKSRDGGSAAVGRYQFILPEYAAKLAGLPMSAKFTPENQDKMAIAYLEKKRRGKEWLSGKISNREYIEDLAREWGAFRSYSGYVLPGNSGKIGPEKIEAALNKVKSTPQQITQQPQRAISTPGAGKLTPLTGTSGTAGGAGRQLSTPISPFLPGTGATITSGKGWRTSTSSYHKGYDVGAKSGTPVYSYFPGVVTRVIINGRGDGGYGNAIEWKDDIHNQTHFYGHLLKPPSISVGTKFGQGTLLGYVGGTGYGLANKYPDHLHWEIGPRGSERDPGEWLRSIGAKPSSSSSKQAQITPTQPTSQQAQISPAPTQQAQQQVAQQITPERKAQDIVAVVPPSTPQQPAVSQGPAPSQQQTAPSMGELLNNFIKQKFLLDLSFL